MNGLDKGFMGTLIQISLRSPRREGIFRRDPGRKSYERHARFAGAGFCHFRSPL